MSRIGTAGWNVPRQYAAAFPGEGSHLARYAARFSAVEINTSFYRDHKPETYARWAASVPEDFRFAVKVPREITHNRKLANYAEPLDIFLAGVSALGPKLGPLLIQLPPSFAYDEKIAAGFFEDLRARFAGRLACEPRHPTWFDSAADGLLTKFEIARVAADPAPVPEAAIPGGWPGLIYMRLHGSPEMYYSTYTPEKLKEVAHTLNATTAQERWCIFDNTARGEAAGNALTLKQEL